MSHLWLQQFSHLILGWVCGIRWKCFAYWKVHLLSGSSWAVTIWYFLMEVNDCPGNARLHPALYGLIFSSSLPCMLVKETRSSRYDAWAWCRAQKNTTKTSMNLCRQRDCFFFFFFIFNFSSSILNTSTNFLLPLVFSTTSHSQKHSKFIARDKTNPSAAAQSWCHSHHKVQLLFQLHCKLLMNIH